MRRDFSENPVQVFKNATKNDRKGLKPDSPYNTTLISNQSDGIYHSVEMNLRP